MDATGKLRRGLFQGLDDLRLGYVVQVALSGALPLLGYTEPDSRSDGVRMGRRASARQSAHRQRAADRKQVDQIADIARPIPTTNQGGTPGQGNAHRWKHMATVRKNCLPVGSFAVSHRIRTSLPF